MAHRPVGSGVSIAVSTTSAKTSAIYGQTNVIRLVSVGANAFVAIGTEPTATTSNYFLPAGVPQTHAIVNGQARVVGVTTGNPTLIDFPEGTASPFGVGDYVTLIASGQTYYNFTHQPVTSVYNSSSFDGYFSTRVAIGTNTSGIVTAFSDPDTVLKNSFKIAALTDSGSGTLYAQQVQISGQA